MAKECEDGDEVPKKILELKNRINEDQDALQIKKQGFQEELESIMTELHKAFINKRYNDITLDQPKFYEMIYQQV